MANTIFDIEAYNIPEYKVFPKNEASESASIIILLKSEDYKNQKELLLKILKAINIDFQEDVFLIEIDEGQNCHTNRQILPSTKFVLSFGLGIKSIGLNAKFVANRFYKTESYSIMLTHSLTKLSTDMQNKKALWAALQKTFINK